MAEQQDYLSSLNDDCIFEILERLSLNDLCAVSRTSKKLRTISENHFQRNYPELVSKTVVIGYKRRAICIKKAERCMICFSRQIHNVHIQLPGRRLTNQLLQFMDIFCCRNIKKIGFSSGTWTKSFKRGINDWLSCVESIFFDIHSCCDISLNDALKLPRVKCLKVYDLCNKKLPLVDCPGLEVFDCCIGTRSSGILDEMKVLFRQWPKLRRFTCRLFNPKSEWLKQLLAAVVTTEIKELFIELCCFGEEVDFAVFRLELEKLNECEHFKRFELKVDAQEVRNLMELTSLKTFTGLYLANWNGPSHLDRCISTYTSFVDLERLWLNGNVSEDFCVSLARRLSNLKLIGTSGQQAFGTIIPFVRYAAGLNTIVVHESQTKHKFPTIATLNAERRKLDSASNVVIYLTTCGAENVQSSESSEIVEIKRICRSTSHSPDLPNPFVQYEFSCEDILANF